MTGQARWPTLVFAWALAAAVTALIAWRAVHFVGGQLFSDIAISRPRAAAAPTPRPTPRPTSQGTPTATPGQPVPDVPVVRPPDAPQPAPTPPTPGPGTGGPGTPPPVIDGPGVPPVPVPQPNPQPNPQPPPPVAEPPDDDDEVVALPPPFVPAPDVSPPSGPAASPPPQPQPSPIPVTISDRRAVETLGGMATFTCTTADEVALETTAPAPGYVVGRIRLREISRMEVRFVGPTEEEPIDARCEDGTLDASAG